ncbi:MAG: hypothetical protein J7K21_02830 [Desulfurococcales archaeon]|nr:hypothetical protein [Desulfurococcales archaeon]
MEKPGKKKNIDYEELVKRLEALEERISRIERIVDELYVLLKVLAS